MNTISIISLAAKKAGIASSLLISLCASETGLKNINNYNDPNGGSFGICQISRAAAREIIPGTSIKDLQDPSINSYIAAMYLKKKIKKYGFSAGIAAYNSGSPKYRNNVLINQKYVYKVQGLMYNMVYGK